MDIDSLILEALPGQIGQQCFDTWFGDRVHFDLRESTLFVDTSDSFRAGWLSENLEHNIAQVCVDLFGTSYPIRFTVGEVPIQELGRRDIGKTKRFSEDGEHTQNANRAQETLKGHEQSSRRGFYQQPSFEKTSVMTGKGSRSQVLDSVRSLSFPEKPTDIHPVEGKLPSVPKQSGKEPVLRESRPYNTVDVRAPKSGHHRNASLNTGRTFETFATFVDGMSNRLARSGADIALTEPGKINPVYIYGGTSVGKTHLLEAIYSSFRERSRFGAPLFMTAEQFTTVFLQSIRGKSDGPSFRDRFNNISLFILDDVHFLKGKDVTQCELVSVIDMLKRRNVQLFFSGNSAPSDLTDLRPDLVARLGGGFFCRIESPERETLLKIFHRQAARMRFTVPDDVCRFVVSRLSSHVRLLYGALNRLYAIHMATGMPVTLDMARRELGDFLQCSRRTIRLEDIESAVLEIFGMTDASLRTKSRAKQFAYPRMLAMYLARKYTRSALSEIGRYFGDRSHSTVISAQKKIDALLSDNRDLSGGVLLPTVSQTLERIETILQI